MFSDFLRFLHFYHCSSMSVLMSSTSFPKKKLRREQRFKCIELSHCVEKSLFTNTGHSHLSCFLISCVSYISTTVLPRQYSFQVNKIAIHLPLTNVDSCPPFYILNRR
eukprot:g67670.t1